MRKTIWPFRMSLEATASILATYSLEELRRASSLHFNTRSDLRVAGERGEWRRQKEAVDEWVERERGGGEGGEKQESIFRERESGVDIACLAQIVQFDDFLRISFDSFTLERNGYRILSYYHNYESKLSQAMQIHLSFVLLCRVILNSYLTLCYVQRCTRFGLIWFCRNSGTKPLFVVPRN